MRATNGGDFAIKEFAASQTTLEQIFNTFAKETQNTNNSIITPAKSKTHFQLAYKEKFELKNFLAEGDRKSSMRIRLAWEKLIKNS